MRAEIRFAAVCLQVHDKSVEQMEVPKKRFLYILCCSLLIFNDLMCDFSQEIHERIAEQREREQVVREQEARLRELLQEEALRRAAVEVELAQGGL